MAKRYFVYIITNFRNTVVYIGVTSKLDSRLHEHGEKLSDGSFAAQNNLNKLVYVEVFEDPRSAIMREKQLKGWVRKKKDALIESKNPFWEDIRTRISPMD